MFRVLKEFAIIVGLIVAGLFAIAVFARFNESDDPAGSVKTASAAPAPLQCESGWTQRSSSIYFLNPEGCNSTKLVLSSSDQRLHLGFINDESKDCDSYDVSGTAYASVKLINANVNGSQVQLTRSCVNGDEMFTPNTDADSGKLFVHANEDRTLTIRFGNGSVLTYQNTNYREAADNLIRFTGINP